MQSYNTLKQQQLKSNDILKYTPSTMQQYEVTKTTTMCYNVTTTKLQQQ